MVRGLTEPAGCICQATFCAPRVVPIFRILPVLTVALASSFVFYSVIWATIYQADRGYGFSDAGGNNQKILAKLEAIERRLESLEGDKAKSENNGAIILN